MKRTLCILFCLMSLASYAFAAEATIENRETVLDKKDIKEKKISRNIFPLEEIKHDDKKEIKEEIKNIEIKSGNKKKEKKPKEENKSETNKEKLKSDIEEISKSIKLIYATTTQDIRCGRISAL